MARFLLILHIVKTNQSNVLIMRSAIILGIIAITFFACSTAKEPVRTNAVLEHTESQQDSTEYEVIIYDNRFDLWYALNYSEAKDRSNEYYRSKNIVASSAWDDYFRRGKYETVVLSQINYQPQVDYGIEVNRKLYWYFKFVEENYGIALNL